MALVDDQNYTLNHWVWVLFLDNQQGPGLQLLNKKIYSDMTLLIM